MFYLNSTFNRPRKGRFAFALLGLVLSACQLIPSNGGGSVSLIQEASSTQEESNLEQIYSARADKADLAELASQFNGGIRPESDIRQSWQLGDTDLFFYTEQQNETQTETMARAAYVSDGLIMWIEEGVKVDESDILEAADTLENEIFPTTRQLFGTEPSPGIDGNSAIHILHIGDLGGSTIGYFSGKDEYPRWVAPNSNQREMFYINLDFVEIGSWDYYDVVAHEFQHMVQWNVDRNEHTWINEGLAELSSMVNGYGASEFLPAYLRNPDTSLTGFSYEGGDYAAAWLMMAWLREQYGDEFVQNLMQQQEDSVRGINTLLESQDPAVNFSEIYADWMVAVYGVNHNLKLDSKYAFESVSNSLRRAQSIDPVRPRTEDLIETTVGQYGSDYWVIPADQKITITLTQTQQVPLFSDDPFEGDWYWTTVPADFSSMHLTRSVDLSAVSSATLQFQAFYDIEVGYDYAYVSVSADGGATWETVSTTASVDTNPHGKNFGNGITGISAGLESPAWVMLTGDLSPWSGASYDELLLRFNYITDDAVQHEGLAIDNITIPELNWEDGAENGEDGWTAVGFVRHTNRLPQSFVVQTMSINTDETAQVTRFQSDSNGVYRIEITPSPQLEETILAVAGTTPVTRQPAGYHLFIQPDNR